MNNYLSYLQSIQEPNGFVRKIRYIRYNFSKYIDFKKKNLSILEIGPGMGEFLFFLNKNKITNIDVFDNDTGVLDYINEKYKIHKSFFGRSILKAFEKLRKYDIVFMLQVLEHIPKSEYVPLINCLYKKLEAGGKIIITVPNGGNPLNLSERYSDITHEILFTENSLRQLCSLCQLNNAKISIVPYKIPPTSFVNIIRTILQGTLHFFVKMSMILNGGIYSKILTPNITLIITKMSVE